MLILYRLGHALWFFCMVGVSPVVAKVRRGRRGRKGLVDRVSRARGSWDRAPYWFHFASSGEFEQAIPILDALKETNPEAPIFLSYFSPSGKRAVQLEWERRHRANIPVPWDGSDYSPLDFPWTVKTYLDALQPRTLILLNREFWPELLRTCSEAGIAVFLFAAFLSGRARRFIALYRPWLESVTFLGTTDSNTADFLRSRLSGPTVEAVGDSRIERVLSRRCFSRLSEGELPVLDSPVFVAASLWPEDFQALEPSLELLLQADPSWVVFLVPHEPDSRFLRQIECRLSSQNYPVVRWKSFLPAETNKGVVLVDKVGLLAELYQFASLAFVGGSFRSRVHSVLEPAAYGVPILTGPFISNSWEARQMAQSQSGLFVAATPRILHDHVQRYAMDKTARKQDGQAALNFLRSRVGASKRYAEILSGHQ